MQIINNGNITEGLSSTTHSSEIGQALEAAGVFLSCTTHIGRKSGALEVTTQYSMTPDALGYHAIWGQNSSIQRKCYAPLCPSDDASRIAGHPLGRRYFWNPRMDFLPKHFKELLAMWQGSPFSFARVQYERIMCKGGRWIRDNKDAQGMLEGFKNVLEPAFFQDMPILQREVPGNPIWSMAWFRRFEVEWKR